ncbi:hypothetical protein K402DRAFT_164738 [Aulographum hederae CBS 113979]|uniref:O-methyltransferase dimerisation domain-containing protein n=1 Tax=Aulographum hederae CBS 113979 TaxID=1176131 RepID=A0A6G1GRK9_9PEZI|nr:hypothetical protein K402DRAFT_164738 [Aulographum hederae CBS 113979]
MSEPPQITKPAVQLRKILSLLSTAGELIISEWEQNAHQDSPQNKSHTEYIAVKTVIAVVGSLESLILEPHVQLLPLSTSYMIARAPHVAAEKDVANQLDAAGERGMSAQELAQATGAEEGKLCRIMRALTPHNVFVEVEEDRFADNNVSQTRVGDTAFRSHIIIKCGCFIHYISHSSLLTIAIQRPSALHSKRPPPQRLILP